MTREYFFLRRGSSCHRTQRTTRIVAAAMVYGCFASSCYYGTADGFQPTPSLANRICNSCDEEATSIAGTEPPALFDRFRTRTHRRRSKTWLSQSFFAADGREDDDEDEEDDDCDSDDDGDDYIDTESLGDWRTFRRSLAMGETRDDSKKDEEPLSILSEEREVTENEKVLREQNKNLAEEYVTDRWAYETPTPEVGGLVLRMPLEVELFRNHKHSIIGSKLRALLVEDAKKVETSADELPVGHWYERSRKLVEEQMKKIADNADEEGQIDATTLPEDFSEMLSLYLDNQEQWQEVCLVLEKTTYEEGSHSAKTLVLNRPMAFQLTKDLAKIVYLGAFGSSSSSSSGRTKVDSIADSAKGLTRFKIAFREECAIYVGGPDHQGEPATVIHGIADLPGATEISPGSGIYRGGLEAAVDGVLDGTYHPLDFRFFVGCHDYPESMLDVEVTLGKFQPVACSRVLALKQCISLPQPLWHEVMELCADGDMPELSALELKKHEDVTFQVLEDDDLSGILGLDDYDDDDELDVDIEILDDDADDDAPWGW